jgi:DNA-binding response OmpR family regulator
LPDVAAIDAPDVWLSQETLLTEVFGVRRTYDTALVRVHIHALRKALGAFAQCIESCRGRGYRLVEIRGFNPTKPAAG